jgi:predicted membrane channel-forming protein YqfA (hemolysin III family)
MGAAHVPITSEHLSEAPYIGWAFVALEIASIALALALVTSDTPLTWWAATVVPALAITGYVVSRTVGLPQIDDEVGNWTEPLSFVALSAEALLIVIAGAHRAGSWHRSRLVARPVLLSGLLLLAGLVATGCAAVGTSG